MKIVCDSCGAKYSIADEKVAGKTFKIRCKKCGENIVVRGDAQATPSNPAPVDTQGADAVWHVVVDGEQQGPLAPAQFAELLSAGRIDWDAYVWREGFDNWLPAQECPELVQGVTGGSGDSQDATAVEGAGHAAMFGADSPAATGPTGPTGAAVAKTGDADLFGGNDVFAPKPAPKPAAMTGQRNENSVLFSLQNLQALATGGPASNPSVAPKAKGPTEGSGLIDIRALASAASSVGGGAASSPAFGGSNAPGRRSAVDDLIALGGGGSSPFGGGATLGAPVLAPIREKKDNRMVFAILGAAAIVTIGVVGAVFAMNATKTEAPVAGNLVAPPATTVAPAAQPAAPVAAQAPSSPTTQQPVGNTGAVVASNDTNPGSRRTGGSGTKHGGGGGARPSSSNATPTTPPPAEPRRGGSSDIAALLEKAVPTNGRPRAAENSGGGGGGSDLAPTPTRQEVQDALNGVKDAVAACGGGQHGLATTQISVSGTSGRVTNATVSGQFAGTPIGSCVARSVRGARFPRFSQSTFTVTYPFRL